MCFINNRKGLPAVLVLILFASAMACAHNKFARVSKPELPRLIDSLYHADQSTMNLKPADSAAAAYQRVIRSNFPLVEGIYKQFGFPGFDAVGKETSNKYFLLVQHSDFNLPFQQKVLRAIEKEVKNKNASAQNYAYLVDRIEINNNRPQVYGTQIIMSGDTKMKPCIDTINLDKRRQAIGLSTIREYLDKCNETFYQLNPTEKNGAKQ